MTCWVNSKHGMLNKAKNLKNWTRQRNNTSPTMKILVLNTPARPNLVGLNACMSFCGSVVENEQRLV